MVEQTRHWTNHGQLSDFIDFVPIPKAVNSALIKDLYLKDGLTASQIADRVGLSKAAVLTRLHQIRIRKCDNKGRSNDNFRFKQYVPFGKKIVGGKLTEDRKEMKTVRLIIELRKRQNLQWKCIANKLNMSNIRTKKGFPWKVGTVKMVYQRWIGKC